MWVFDVLWNCKCVDEEIFLNYTKYRPGRGSPLGRSKGLGLLGRLPGVKQYPGVAPESRGRRRAPDGGSHDNFYVGVDFPTDYVLIWLALCLFFFACLPINRHGSEIEHTGCHSDDGNEVVELAVDLSEHPVALPHVDVVENSVEDGQQQVRQTHVDDERVGYCPHVTVSWKQFGKIDYKRVILKLKCSQKVASPKVNVIIISSDLYNRSHQTL